MTGAPVALAAIEGFFLGIGLIAAIGAQNAFVLEQGLKRRHVGPVVAFGAVSDAALILVGALGFGALIRQSDRALTIVFFAGAAVLALYAAAALRRAIRGGGRLEADAGAADVSLPRALGVMATLTFLNPHVYLDTVVLLGGVAGQHPSPARAAFAGGAMTASVVWFTSLGFGARLAAPLFRRPGAWRIFDLAVAAIMASIALGLLREALTRL